MDGLPDFLGSQRHVDVCNPERGKGVHDSISNRGRVNGGMLQLEDVKPFWLPHFHVADVDFAISRVKELGGAIIIDMQVDADGKRWSVVADPAGAHFYVMQLLKADPWVE